MTRQKGYRWAVSIGGNEIGTATPPTTLSGFYDWPQAKAQRGDVCIRSVRGDEALVNWLLERPPRKIPLLELRSSSGEVWTLVDVHCQNARKDGNSKAKRLVVDVLLRPRLKRVTGADIF